MPRRHPPTGQRAPSTYRLAVLAGVLAVACGEGRAASDELSHLRLIDVTAASGIDIVNVSGDPRRWYIPESNGCGAAWLDHDGDGDMDLFVANGSGMRYVDDGRRLEVVPSGTSRLYRNDGKMRFTDVTQVLGVARSDWINAVVTGDVDSDGDTDLYLACFGDDVFLRRDTADFASAAAEHGLANPYWSAGAAFGDANRDGHLDLYVANYCIFDLEAPPLEGRRNVIEGVEVGWGPEGENGRGLNPGAPDFFFYGSRGGQFIEATERAGVALKKPLCSYAVVFSDVDQDGWQDILVANDLQPSNLFHNRGDGTFDEEGIERGFAFNAAGEPTSAMGLLVADIEYDGDEDVLRTNFDLEPNSLHINDGKGYYQERAEAYGLIEPSFDRLGWGGGFFDADLDGDLDLIVANGHVYPQAEEIGMHPWAQLSQLFEGRLHRRFGVEWFDVTEGTGGGLSQARSARGLALADADDDGDVDAILIDMDEQPRLLENRSARAGRWLAVRTIGKWSNRDGYGARVVVHTNRKRWSRVVRTSNGLYSAHDPRVHFGLGPIEEVDKIVVHWPSGITQTVEDPRIDRLHVITESDEAR